MIYDWPQNWNEILSYFSFLSCLSIGGGFTILPEMQTIMKNVFSISPEKFAHAYALGRLTPGSTINVTIILLGYKIAGNWGAFLALLGFLAPSSLICFFVGKFWFKWKDEPWRKALTKSLAPIILGLIFSGAYTILTMLNSIVFSCLALGVFALSLYVRLNFVYAVLICGLTGIFIGWVG